VITRGRRGLLTAAIMAILGVAGCTPAPGGPDGRLADDWAALPAAQSVRPNAGECHRDPAFEHTSGISYDVITCSGQRHYVETVYVGRFTGEAANLSAPPYLRRNDTSANGKAYAEAFAECDREGTRYLGHSWYSLTVYLDVITPTRAAWEGGARWFRCDLYTLDWATGKRREMWSSLKDKWNPQACVQIGKTTAPLVDCADWHNAEFVGGYAFDDRPAPKTEADWRPLWTKCYPLIAKYLGISLTQVAERYGAYAYPVYNTAFWPSGARVVRCFLYLGKARTTGSAQGTGTRTPRYS
jgi:Septum formation